MLNLLLQILLSLLTWTTQSNLWFECDYLEELWTLQTNCAVQRVLWPPHLTSSQTGNCSQEPVWLKGFARHCLYTEVADPKEGAVNLRVKNTGAQIKNVLLRTCVSEVFYAQHLLWIEHKHTVWNYLQTESKYKPKNSFGSQILKAWSKWVKVKDFLLQISGCILEIWCNAY